MTYEQIVEMVRSVYEHRGDAREVFEHVAIQVNIIGEGHGAFYVEIANRQISVEPYEYYDRDGIITLSGKVLEDIVDERITFREALDKDLIQVQGNMEKIRLLGKVHFSGRSSKRIRVNPEKKAVQKKPEDKKETEKKPAQKESEDKKETEKKPAERKHDEKK